MPSQRTQAIVSLLVAASLWSTGGVLIKGVEWNGLAISGARSAIAAITMWALLRRPRFTWSRSQLGGAIAYATSVLLYVSSVKHTTAANAILLQYSAPIWIALFGNWFLGEHTTRFDWLTIAVSLGGMSLFSRKGLTSPSFWGDLLGALSGVTIAWMTLFLRRQKLDSPTEFVLLGNILAALVGLPFAEHMPAVSDWPALLALGALQLGLSYFMWSRAIKHVSALEAILFSMLEPILSPIWVMLLVGERPDGWALVGGALVLLAVAVRGILPALGDARRTSNALREV